MSKTDLLSDEQLVAAASRGGDDEAFALLVGRFMPRIRAAVARHGHPGDEDLIQEGLLALYRAMQSYRPEGGAAFATYASRCVDNACLSVLRAQTASRRIPAEQIASLDETDTSDLTVSSPEQQIVDREQAAFLYRQMRALLSDLEYRVWTAHLAGFSLADTAARLGISQKSADNALSRARKKLTHLPHSS